nr:hypothetical protein [Tanacetum cinerariifolium]
EHWLWLSERADILLSWVPNHLNTPPSFSLEFCLGDLARPRLILERYNYSDACNERVAAINNMTAQHLNSMRGEHVYSAHKVVANRLPELSGKGVTTIIRDGDSVAACYE